MGLSGCTKPHCVSHMMFDVDCERVYHQHWALCFADLLCVCFRFQKNSPLGPKLPPFGGAVTSSEGYLLGLWVHECRRVFADKLVTPEDRNWVDKTIVDLCKQEFPQELCKQVLCGLNMAPATMSLLPYKCYCSRALGNSRL